MRYNKLVEMMKAIVREETKHRSSSQSHTMVGRYSRKKGEMKLAQEEENTGETMTGKKANPIQLGTAFVSINQTR
jgi:hypothetical protein